MASKLLICSSMLYLAINDDKHPVICYTLIVPLCVCYPTQRVGREIEDRGMSVNFNYDKVLIKLQTKCNTNSQIMIMLALESISQPSSSHPPAFPRHQFFYALMSNNAKRTVICLLIVCITVSQGSNEKQSDVPLKSLLLHRYKSIGQHID